MKKLQFNHMLALLSTMTLVAGSQAVYAQQASDTAEEIVVTGFKASLEKSAELKKESDAIVEAVSAEDIGKLPDQSIAESLQRLPGLATQRINGRAQVISIRGMDPDFGTTLFNGRQQVSTGDNRSIEYDQYPAEFISSAMVYKTPTASLIGQGIAGTTDLRTVRPLTFGKKAVVVNVRLEQNAKDAANTDASNKGNRETISYIDQFNDNTLGLALGYSHTDTPTQGERFAAWGYPTIKDTNGNDVAVIGGAKPFVQSNTVKRDSVMGTLEYAPSDTFSTTVDAFYSTFKEDQLLRGIELPLQWSSAQLQPGYTVENGLVTSGTFKNVQGVIRSDAELREATIYSLGWNTKFALGDTWKGEADISTSNADREDKVVENYSGYIGGPDTLSFKTTSKGTKFTSSVDYSDASKVRITNLQSWGGNFVPSAEGGQKGYYKQPASTDELTQIRFSASRDLDWGFVNKVEMGVDYDTRKKHKTTSPEYYFALPGHATQAPLPSKLVKTDLGFLGLGSILGYDPLGPMKDGTYVNILAVRADVTAKEWTVEEKISTAYVKFNLDTDVFEKHLTGNFGGQFVGSDQSSHAFSAQGESAGQVTVPSADGITYNNFLPSVNLSLEVLDKSFVRLGAARTLTRARMDDLRASSQFGLNTNTAALSETTNIENSPWSASGGNPRLKPWVADGADISFEQYFDGGVGYYSIAAFYKDLNTYVVQSKTIMDFSDFPIPDGLVTQPHMFVGYRSVPANGNGGDVKGLEFTLSLTGDVISDALSGFGMIATSSYTDSNIHPAGTPSNKLPGLSKNVHGLQFYYENEGFSARISQNYRSKFLGELAGFDALRNQRIVEATKLVDAQVGYAFNEGSLEGLTVSFQAFNLNDEPFVTTQNGDERRSLDYQSYGRTYALNFNYKM